MTPSPDLLAVLREAREFVADYLDPDSDPGLVLAQRTLDRIDSALSAHEAQGWRPIAEAPKDGTRIIVTNGTRVETARWLDNRHGKYAWAGWHFGSLVPAMTPNAWQPLPPPPETTT